jgi:hypothetical protein
MPSDILFTDTTTQPNYTQKKESDLLKIDESIVPAIDFYIDIKTDMTQKQIEEIVSGKNKFDEQNSEFQSKNNSSINDFVNKNFSNPVTLPKLMSLYGTRYQTKEQYEALNRNPPKTINGKTAFKKVNDTSNTPIKYYEDDHGGIDIVDSSTTTIYDIFSVCAGDMFVYKGTGGMGNTIFLANKQNDIYTGLVFVYLHTGEEYFESNTNKKPFPASITKLSQSITSNIKIGTYSNSGTNASPNHLHLEGYYVPNLTEDMIKKNQIRIENYRIDLNYINKFNNYPKDKAISAEQKFIPYDSKENNTGNPVLEIKRSGLKDENGNDIKENVATYFNYLIKQKSLNDFVKYKNTQIPSRPKVIDNDLSHFNKLGGQGNYLNVRNIDINSFVKENLSKLNYKAIKYLQNVADQNNIRISPILWGTQYQTIQNNSVYTNTINEKVELSNVSRSDDTFFYMYIPLNIFTTYEDSLPDFVNINNIKIETGDNYYLKLRFGSSNLPLEFVAEYSNERQYELKNKKVLTKDDILLSEGDISFVSIDKDFKNENNYLSSSIGANNTNYIVHTINQKAYYYDENQFKSGSICDIHFVYKKDDPDFLNAGLVLNKDFVKHDKLNEDQIDFLFQNYPTSIFDQKLGDIDNVKFNNILSSSIEQLSGTNNNITYDYLNSNEFYEYKSNIISFPFVLSKYIDNIVMLNTGIYNLKLENDSNDFFFKFSINIEDAKFGQYKNFYNVITSTTTPPNKFKKTNETPGLTNSQTSINLNNSNSNRLVNRFLSIDLKDLYLRIIKNIINIEVFSITE